MSTNFEALMSDIFCYLFATLLLMPSNDLCFR